MKSELHGLEPTTRNILVRGGLDTRKKIADAGEVKWLMLNGFGQRRMREVQRWLGDDSPSLQREISRCVKFLEAHGYTVKKSNA